MTVDAVIAACWNKGCAPPPVGKGGSNGGEASGAARIRALQSRGRAVQAVKAGESGAQRQLNAARRKVDTTSKVWGNPKRATRAARALRQAAAAKRRASIPKSEDAMAIESIFKSPGGLTKSQQVTKKRMQNSYEAGADKPRGPGLFGR